MTTKPSISINPLNKQAPTRDYPTSTAVKEKLPSPKSSKTHPSKQFSRSNDDNASLFFVGTATTIIEWKDMRLMTDPNLLHAGEHVHLGPGVTSMRRTNPAVDLHDLPHIDLVLLSHYHEDHFDKEVEASLRRDLPIITTPHAKSCLTTLKSDADSFTNIHALDKWDNMFVNISVPTKPDLNSYILPRLRVEGMPGKHVGDGLLSKANDLLGAVPPTNGWMLELGYAPPAHAASFNNQDATVSADVNSRDFACGYRNYISGDTLYVNELARISELYTHAGKPIDLMLIHLGGTTLPGPQMPLLMVTMDAQQGLALVKLIQPDLTVPIHYE
ncbi:hypothetical protein LTR84_011445 [Exophiala bonariae]|uniref:Metallo-beta-lactamase domain-containing protein n=1 Tax=Exophiala bonariae TaxID=1690606 RepID=A0AAV9MVB0_9EURO|nr:hypothetical protein LTR84_011445 [Exophiala bonariae]